jgi:hypothetical protein
MRDAITLSVEEFDRRHPSIMSMPLLKGLDCLEGDKKPYPAISFNPWVHLQLMHHGKKVCGDQSIVNGGES